MAKGQMSVPKALHFKIKYCKYSEIWTTAHDILQHIMIYFLKTKMQNPKCIVWKAKYPVIQFLLGRMFAAVTWSSCFLYDFIRLSYHRVLAHFSMLLELIEVHWGYWRHSVSIRFSVFCPVLVFQVLFLQVCLSLIK